MKTTIFKLNPELTELADIYRTTGFDLAEGAAKLLNASGIEGVVSYYKPWGVYSLHVPKNDAEKAKKVLGSESVLKEKK